LSGSPAARAWWWPWTLAGARRPVYRAPNDIVELSADQRLDASDVVAGWSPLVRELLD